MKIKIPFSIVFKFNKNDFISNVSLLSNLPTVHFQLRYLFVFSFLVFSRILLLVSWLRSIYFEMINVVKYKKKTVVTVFYKLIL